MDRHDFGPQTADREDSARRRFLRIGSGGAAAWLVAALAGCGNEDSPLADDPTPTPSGTPSPTPTGTPTIQALNDTDLLVLMLQLTYLQAEFYSRAVLGVPLPDTLTGATASGVVGPRRVTFTTAVLGDLFREIAFDKIDQVARLRALLGSAAVARPALNLDVTDTGAFTQIARAATVVTASATFDVYANEDAFLLGAFVLEDTVLSAYKGNLPLFATAATVVAVGGLLATSAHHTAVVRSQLYIRGLTTGSTLRQNTIRLSDARDAYSPVDDDQGVSGGTAAAPTTAANVTNADGEGLIYGRPPQFTVNVVYQTRAAVTAGGFFPTGLVGAIRTSATT